MNAENVDQILGVLAERFGTTASHLWDVLIRQAYIEAASGVAWFVFALVVTFWVIRHRDDEWASDDMMGPSIAMIFVGVSTLVFLITGAGAFISGVEAALNPEYFALKEVLSAF